MLSYRNSPILLVTHILRHVAFPNTIRSFSILVCGECGYFAMYSSSSYKVFRSSQEEFAINIWWERFFITSSSRRSMCFKFRLVFSPDFETTLPTEFATNSMPFGWNCKLACIKRESSQLFHQHQCCAKWVELLSLFRPLETRASSSLFGHSFEKKRDLVSPRQTLIETIHGQFFFVGYHLALTLSHQSKPKPLVQQMARQRQCDIFLSSLAVTYKYVIFHCHCSSLVT